jgi:hypothetical protein
MGEYVYFPLTYDRFARHANIASSFDSVHYLHAGPKKKVTLFFRKPFQKIIAEHHGSLYEKSLRKTV